MNVHHLELFYYVATHGGVSAAARQMPYGIQQPAISAQILQLEDVLGVTLYQRRPFQLTREGQLLYDHIAPFFKGLGDVADRVRGGGETRLRIAAPEIVQREYLPELCARMQKRVKGFHFTLTDGRQQHGRHAFGAIKASVQIARGQQRRLELLRAGMSIRERGWGITGHDLFPSYVLRAP